MTLVELRRIIRDLGNQNLPTGVEMPNGLIPNWDSIDPPVITNPIPEIPEFPEFNLPEFPVYPSKPTFDAVATTSPATAIPVTEIILPEDTEEPLNNRWAMISPIIDNPGEGYLIAPTVTFSPAVEGTATGYAILNSSGSVTEIVITYGGVYNLAEALGSYITIDAPPAPEPITATGTPIFDTSQPENNSIIGVNITEVGLGYTDPPTVTFSGGFFTATGTANIANGRVISVTMTSGGLYIDDQLPSVTVTFSAPTGGGGTPPGGGIPPGGGTGTATASAVTTTVPGFSGDFTTVDAVNVTSGGSGYTSAPAVSFVTAGTTLTGATASASISGGSVSSITVTNEGGYLLNGSELTVVISPP